MAKLTLIRMLPENASVNNLIAALKEQNVNLQTDAGQLVTFEVAKGYIQVWFETGLGVDDMKRATTKATWYKCFIFILRSATCLIVTS